MTKLASQQHKRRPPTTTETKRSFSTSTSSSSRTPLRTSSFSTSPRSSLISPSSSSPYLWLCLLVIALTSVPLVNAIKFDLPASRQPEPLCIWNYANAHSLVIVTANVSPGEGQRVDIEIIDGSAKGNIYLAKKGIKGETRLAITTHESADVGVCLRNSLEHGYEPGMHVARTVDLDVDIGADAIDYNAIANQESLSVLEVEMRKLEGVVREIVDELSYLQRREARMRDTNESTNSRVKWFGIFTLITLVGLTGWQLLHLRSFFKRKYLID